MIFPVLLAMYEVIAYLSNDAYLPALPQITTHLNTTHHLVQLTVTMIFIGGASMQLILGSVADRVGRRPVLLLGCLLFILSTTGCALSNSIYWLLFFRLIQGMTITSMVVAGYSTIHDLFDQEKAIYTLAIMASITLLAPAFGPLIGSFILLFSSWRWIFGILAISAIFILIGMFLKMPETINAEAKTIPFKMTVAQYKNIFTNKNFVLYALLSGFLFSSMIAWIAAGPYLLIDRFHFKPHDFGIAQVFVFGGLIIGTRFVKPLVKIMTLNKIIRAGVAVCVIGSIFAIISSLLFPHIVWNTIIAMMIMSGGFGLIFPILNRLMIETSSEPMASRVAVSSFLKSLFGMLGSAIISGFYDEKLLTFAIIVCSLSLIALIIYFKISIVMRLSNKA